MHYDGRIPKQIKSSKEIISILTKTPITREAIVKMIRNGVKLWFIRYPEKRKGFALPIFENGWCIRWLICIDYELPDAEKEETIWHELVHLHLRRTFGCSINDNGEGSEEVHPLIIREGERLATGKLLGYKELLSLLQ